VGVVFGMGFDTRHRGGPIGQHRALGGPTRAVVLDHVPTDSLHRRHGLMDTIDCMFMNVAYGWAFFNPVRKIFYNLAINGSFVAICFFIGAIEVLVSCPMNFT